METEGKRGPPGRPRKTESPLVEVPMVSVVVLRDTWDAAGVRHRAGSVLSVPVPEALDGVEAGMYSRRKG